MARVLKASLFPEEDSSFHPRVVLVRACTNHWQQIEKLYHAALERESGERSAFLDQVSVDTRRCIGRLKQLLAFEQPADSFWEAPVQAAR
jgi:hypothetical protein